MFAWVAHYVVPVQLDRDDDDDGGGGGTQQAEDPSSDEDDLDAGEGARPPRTAVSSPQADDRSRYDPLGAFTGEGHLGRASVVRWLGDVRDKIAQGASPGRRPSPSHPPPAALTLPLLLETSGPPPGAGSSQHHPAPSMRARELHRLLRQGSTYHLNDLDLSAFGAFFENVEQLGMPPSKDLADTLLERFFSTINQVYPVVLEGPFLQQYDAFSQSSILPDGNFTWLAMLNMMFAIGSLSLHSSDPSSELKDRDHLVYFVRARLLHPDPAHIMALPNLEHVQFTLLTGLYLMASNQVNRYACPFLPHPSSCSRREARAQTDDPLLAQCLACDGWLHPMRPDFGPSSAGRRQRIHGPPERAGETDLAFAVRPRPDFMLHERTTGRVPPP